MIAVSSCLAGIACRYDGKDNLNSQIKELVDNKQAICICPEVLGGMPVPRNPVEIVGDKVLTKDGIDCTLEFIAGAKKSYQIIKENNISCAILKSKSPSCGCGKIYDGTFTRKLVEGDGITSAYLKKHGIMVIDENQIDKIKEQVYGKCIMVKPGI